MTNFLRRSHPAAPLMAAAFLAVGCGQAPEKAVDLDDLATSMASASAENEVTLYSQGSGYLVELTGGAAHSLFNTLDAAGFQAIRQRGVEYRLGQAIGCASAGDEAFCQLLANQVDSGDDFEITIHGARFSSSASELFGAIAAQSGVAPASVTQVESDRFVCGKSGNAVWCGLNSEAGPTPVRNAIVAMRFVGLESVGADFVYEGWLITPDGPVSSGRFDVDSNDAYFEFSVADDAVRSASLFVLTIEPAVGDDPAPADTHIVAGAFSSGVARVDVAHPAAFGQDFSTAAGSFILATPSSSDTNDNTLGIWFLDPTAGPGASLELPELPAGWAYEGWVAGPNGPISTGRFTSAIGADSDGAGPTAGPLAGPPFPGQDFINPPMDLVGMTAVISVEPEPDNSPAPFLLKPLRGAIGSDTAPVMQGLDNDAANSNPIGIVGLFDDSGRLIE